MDRLVLRNQRNVRMAQQELVFNYLYKIGKYLSLSDPYSLDTFSIPDLFSDEDVVDTVISTSLDTSNRYIFLSSENVSLFQNDAFNKGLSSLFKEDSNDKRNEKAKRNSIAGH